MCQVHCNADSMFCFFFNFSTDMFHYSLELKNLPNNNRISVPKKFGNRACIIPNFINSNYFVEAFSTVVQLYDGVTLEQTHKIKPVLGFTCTK